MTEVLLLLASLVLIAACGAFVAAEFAFLTVDRATVDRAAEAGDRGAAGVQRALRTLSTQLSGAQVGITITNLAIGFLAEPAIAGLVGPGLRSAGLPAGAIPAVSVTLALVVSTLLTMIFGELVPKNLAIARPLGTAKAVQGFSRAFVTVMAWPIRFLNGAANVILRRVFRVEPQEELASARSADELLSLVRRSGEQGTLESETAVLVQRTLAFAERNAADVMTPRPRLHTLGAEETLLDLLRAVRSTGRSRFPVLGEGLDDLVGVVHARAVLGVPEQQATSTPLRAVAQAPVLVPETMDLDDLLDVLKNSSLQLAVVVDEYGGIAGVVTLEDLVEEIVGEVVDEHDTETASVRELGPGEWSVSGLLRPDEVARHIGVPLPEEEGYETVAGLLTSRLGRLPVPGDSVEVPVQGRVDLDEDPGDDQPGERVRGLRLTAESVDGLRVASLRVRALHEAPLGARERPGDHHHEQQRNGEHR
ncbi:hemolysin family protein [Kineococcus sp. NUM-3379]